MLIKSILIDDQTFDEMGIGFSELPLDKPFEMRGLGKTVVLAGPNGAGKSRLLRLIQKLAPKHLNVQTIDQIKRDYRNETQSVTRWENEVVRYEKLLAESPKEEKNIDNVIQSEQVLNSSKGRVDHLERQLRWSSVLDVEGDDMLRIVSFVPKQPKLVDPFLSTAADADQRADRMGHGTDDAHTVAPAYAQRILRIAMEAGYARQEKGLSGKTPAEENRDELLDILKILLGPDVKLKLNGSRLNIGDIASYPDALSPGQQVLFQFACLLHAQHASLADCIVLMDEPENHLHPAVLTHVVANLRKHLTSGQLWIATHSVPLIAQLMATDNDCLWFVNEGRVKRSGRTPETVLDSLMGGPDGSNHLQNLTMLPAQYAGIRFLTECLVAPDVVGPDIKDPQTLQITEIIRKRVEEKKATGKPLSILDFGAGKGRLLATLRSDSSDVTSWLDYYAYDIDNTNQNDCEREIESTYGASSSPRWYSDLHKLEANIDKASVDIVVMCNVLHEIDPDEWLKLFTKNSIIHNLLSQDGYLLVVEDYGIPVGERAHRYGFFLFDEPELCKLFDISAADRKNRLFVTQNSQDARYHERLKAHLIGKVCVGSISEVTKKSAITKLHDRMLDGVSTFLKEGRASNSAAGRAYARSAQLLANASAWLQVAGK